MIETRESVHTRGKQERTFLQKYVFQGLPRLAIGFDVASIAHFEPTEFMRILDRCERFGVYVHGVEVFSAKGVMILVEVAKLDSSPLQFLPSVIQFCGRNDVSVCGTFRVPSDLLTMPAISAELVSAYNSAEYSVDVHGSRVALRVGNRSEAVRELLLQQNAARGFLITAANPFSRSQAETNEVQTSILRLELEAAGAVIFPSTSAEGEPWHEVGFLAIGLDLLEIEQLGTAFGQNAVLEILSDGLVKLVPLR